MEYVDGQNLSEILKSETPIPIPIVLKITAQILTALDFIHGSYIRHGSDQATKGRILHGDLKPANILLTCDGIVKVSDFGQAKILSTHSYAGFGGTRAYMAPEDFSDKPQSSFQKDIWSVGVILYMMVSGRRPFTPDPSYEGTKEAALEHAIRNDDPPPLNKWREGVDFYLQTAVTRALKKESKERFQTAAEFLDHLKLVGIPHTDEDHMRVRRYVTAFNRMSNFFREQLNESDNSISFPVLAERYLARHPDWKDKETRYEFISPRNSLSHVPEDPRSEWPIPTLALVQKIEGVAERLTGVHIEIEEIRHSTAFQEAFRLPAEWVVPKIALDKLSDLTLDLEASSTSGSDQKPVSMSSDFRERFITSFPDRKDEERKPCVPAPIPSPKFRDWGKRVFRHFQSCNKYQ